MDIYVDNKGYPLPESEQIRLNEEATKIDKISIVRKGNFHKLPQYLQDFWNEPKFSITGTSWFEH